MFVRVCERAHVCTQVQSSSSVLILRVLTVSIESSWQLKEEHKIGKWGGVSMLRPLPPHSSLAEHVWIYSGNATFERNKWEGNSFLLYVWIPSRGVSLRDAVQCAQEEGNVGKRVVLHFFFHQNVTLLWGFTALVGRQDRRHYEIKWGLSVCLLTERYILQFLGRIKDSACLSLDTANTWT